MAKATYIKSYTLGKMVHYMDSRGESFYATGKPMLDILLRELFTRKLRVVKVSYR